MNTRNEKRRSTVRRNMKIETMEDRKMFAADLMQLGEIAQVQTQFNPGINDFVGSSSIILNDGVLTANGTHNDDVITIDEYTPGVIGGITLQASQTQALRTSPTMAIAGRTAGRQATQTSPVDSFVPVLPKVRVTIANEDGDIIQQKSFNRWSVDEVVVNSGFGDDEVVNETNIRSTLNAGPGNDLIHGGGGNDTIYGHGGNDSVFGNGGNDYVHGGDGNDTLRGNNGNDTIHGAAGNDVSYGNAGNDSMSGGTGNDSLYGSSGNDQLDGDSGNDLLNGGSGSDVLSGESGSDTMYGGSGNDEMWGGSHNDTMYGGSGNDEIAGGTGNDTMYGSSGNYTMWGWTGNDTMYGGSGNDTMYGGDHNDRMIGDSGNDNIYGNDGRDTLFGRSGDDYLSGGNGDDGLYGGSGEDELRGGSHDDRFLVLNDVPIQFFGFTIGMTTSDTILDKNGNDAKINFEHGKGKTFNFSGGRWSTIEDGNFTQSEIEDVDASLEDLHRKTGNTKLLKRKDGDEIRVKRLGAQTDGNFNLGGVNSGDTITLMDATFNDGIEKLSRIMFHEIGHNWDNENDDWDAFKGLSGWRESAAPGYTQSTDGDWWYQSSAVFARNYGRTNPKEDFATYFAKVMMEDNGMDYPEGAGGGSVASKEAFFDAFFASL